MLERKTRLDRSAKTNGSSLPTEKDNTFLAPNEDNIMTRKPIRIRRQRIPVLQSGYCAICNLPYNSIDDHVQSKKHQKLIGEDASYIALNGYIQAGVGIESILSLTGIDAIGLDDFSPKQGRRRPAAPKTSSRASSVAPISRHTRASSVVSDIVRPAHRFDDKFEKPREKSAKLQEKHSMTKKTKHRSPSPVEEIKEKGKPAQDQPVRLEYKEYRELRSSTRALAKLTSGITEPETWESGRPKRACIGKQRRLTVDERLVSDNKTYYKVEVLSSKLRSNDKPNGNYNQPEAKSKDDKGLIVKFKKLRNTGKKELIQLNNEATNFLFPRKDETSEDDDDEEEEKEEETIVEPPKKVKKKSPPPDKNEVSSASELEDTKPPDRYPSRRAKESFKVDDETSMDSTASSETRTRRKRRSHVEAFINDNQKYYKFETPVSRLRYHGSYLSPIPPKSNGDMVKVESSKEDKPESCSRKERDKVEEVSSHEEAKEDSEEEEEEELTDKADKQDRMKVGLDGLLFSFETVPVNEKWYQTFHRQDVFEQSYNFGHNYYWNDFVLPYQIPHLRPLDPRTCYHAFQEIKDCILNSKFDEPTSSSDVDALEGVDSPAPPDTRMQESTSEEKLATGTLSTDEDSKLSEGSSGSSAVAQEVKEITALSRKKKSKTGAEMRAASMTFLSGSPRGRNPRKSPRQHASTLAILSSLVNQRKRRSRNPAAESSSTSSSTLPIIPEESPQVEIDQPKAKPTTGPQRQRKKKVDYFALAQQIEDELNTALDFDFSDFEPTTDPDTSFLDSRVTAHDVMTMYEQSKAKEDKQSCKKFFNGSAPRKPLKKRKNMTGWPKPSKVKKKRLTVTKTESNNNETSGEESDKEADADDRENKCDGSVQNRVDSGDIRDTKILQPYVYVKKLDTELGVKKLIIKTPVRRPVRKRRVIPTSPLKPPRISRRHRGRWYRDR
ncbi:protein chiffon isoform X3 [Anthonomus grandis grandis]|uniref:protein chiffon isoform X3 n=1 Tax=Anthonomus grandis grandis TaxID=2921223 RepID=UPI002166795A|nr:protein chiffon isoform X3 [Anthonomus grandis grandis]